MVGPGRVGLPTFTMSKTFSRSFFSIGRKGFAKRFFPKLFPNGKRLCQGNVINGFPSQKGEQELTTRPRAHKRNSYAIIFFKVWEQVCFVQKLSIMQSFTESYYVNSVRTPNSVEIALYFWPAVCSSLLFVPVGKHPTLRSNLPNLFKKNRISRSEFKAHLIAPLRKASISVH